MESIETLEIVLCLVAGLLTGMLGGMLGIGGSLVLIPFLAVVFGSEGQHLYQASAMIVNLGVALAALGRHWKSGVVQTDALKRMIPSALLFIVLGVYVSNRIDSKYLATAFSVFLIYVVLVNTKRLIARFRGEPPLPPVQNSNGSFARKDTIRTSFVGSIMGFFAGLLGIGGGGIGVPMLQIVCRFPLKQCIGTSTAVICVTSGVGAVLKNITLNDVSGGQYTMQTSLTLALLIVPGAVIGARVGAKLTHRLPTQWVRLVFILLLIAAGLKMSGVL